MDGTLHPDAVIITHNGRIQVAREATNGHSYPIVPDPSNGMSNWNSTALIS